MSCSVHSDDACQSVCGTSRLKDRDEGTRGAADMGALYRYEAVEHDSIGKDPYYNG